MSFTHLANGQYYERVYGDSVGTRPVFFHIGTDGGLVIAGNSIDNNNNSEYYLLRTDAYGTEKWNKRYYDAFNSYSRSVTTLKDNGIFLLGSHESTLYHSTAEALVLDSNGVILYSNTYPPLNGWGTSGVGLCNQSDTTVSILIYNDGVVSNNFFSVYALNPDLSIRWNDFVGVDDSYTTEHGIASIENGVYTISYYDQFFYVTPPLFNVTHVRKHDDAGVLTLDSLYEFGCLTSVITSSHDNGALISGDIDVSGQFDVALFRIDSSGQLMWQKNYGSLLSEVCNSVTMTHDSGFVILTTVDDSILPGMHDLMIIKIDQNGDSLWSRKFGGTLDERGLHIETINSDIVLLGNTNSNGSDHVYVVRMDSSGVIQAPYNIQVNQRYFCGGDTAVLLIDPLPRSDMHIQWSNGDTINPIRVTETGSFYAIITDTGGITYRTPMQSVYFASTPDASFGPDTIHLCEGSLLIDTVSNDLTDIYQWYLDGTILPGENLNYLQPTQSGVYSLTVTNYCSSDSGSAFVDTLYQVPAMPVIQSSHTSLVCPGDSALLTFAGDNLSTYKWFRNEVIISMATDTFYFASSDGEYFVQAININGCIASAFPVNVMYDDDHAYINSNGPTAFCFGGEITLTISNGTGFHWSNNDTTQAIIVNSSGDYFVSFIDVYGCLKTSDTVTVLVLQRPVVSLGNDTMLCSGSSITLDAGSGYSNYLWNNNTTDQTLVLMPSPPFPDSINTIVYVVDSNGCPGSDTIQVVFEICASVEDFTTDKNPVFPSLLRSGGTLFIREGGKTDFILYDMTGRFLLRTKDREFELPDVVPGIYTYHLATQNGFFSGKIIVQ